MTTVAGLDVGATTVRAALADEHGEMLSTATEPTPTASRDDVVEAIQTVLSTAADGAGIPLDSVATIGIGAMGPLDSETGSIVDPPNVPGIDRIPVVDAVRRFHDGDIVFRNDATAGVIGERFYADGDCENLVYLTLSSGIGAGAIVNGHVLRGATGNAAEMGHVMLAPDTGRQCGCGGVGHWEALCSGHNIPATVRTLAADAGVETALDLDSLSTPELFDAVGTDPLADIVVERLADWNAQGVAALVHAYDPERIAVGGAVATSNPETVIDPLRRRLPAFVVGDSPTVDVTALGSDAVLRGGIASALTGGTGEPL